MSAQRRSVRDIFHDAVEIPAAADRACFLASECVGDLSLRERVESLLQARDADTAFMQRSAADLLIGIEIMRTEGHSAARVGAQIGRYLLLEKIGEGGMGAVYLAMQQEPVRRRVALKIIKAGLDTREFVRRFEAERQALALMNHANIAKVLDGGTTQAGLPYFVMELVDGSPITEFCDSHMLNIGQRLSLFVDVCHAVQHAHQQGIVHRDLKPSNILVEMQQARPVAKIIDFGVAKVIEEQNSLNFLNTSFQQLIGTPLYMSPEQAGYESQRIDLRSDVYSLGVILYELLIGQTPFDREQLRQSGQDELRRIIRDVEPPMPSVRFGRLEAAAAETISRNRAGDRAGLIQLVRRELDWITMKALEKDRSRRYASPGDLAADLQRHLRREAVHAGPRSKTYRFRKMATKHRRLLAALMCAIISLVAGIAVSLWQASEAELAKQQTTELQKTAEKERLQLQRVGIREAYAAWERQEFSEASTLLENLSRIEQGSPSLPEWKLLHQEIRKNFCRLLKTNKPLHEVRSIPGTSHAAAVGGEGIVYIVDVPSCRLIRKIATGVPSLHALVISDDGKLLATGGVTNPVTDRSVPLVFDVQTGERVLELAGQLTTIESLIFSADRRFLLCGSRYENAQVFDLTTKVAVEISAHDRHRWFSRSQDGKHFAAQESEQVVRVADAEPPFSGYSIPFNAVPISAGWIPETTVLRTFLDGTHGIRMRVDGSASESTGNICDLVGVKNAECIVVDDTRMFVAAGLTNGEVIFWPFPSSIEPVTVGDVPDIPAVDRLHISDHSLSSMSIWNEWILATTLGGELLVVRTPEQLLTTQHMNVPQAPDEKVVAWSPDGQSLLTADDDGAVWRAEILSSLNAADHQLKIGKHVNISASDPELVTSAAISEDGNSIALVRNWDSVILIQNGTEKMLYKCSNDNKKMGNDARDPVQFSPDSQYLAWIDHAEICVVDVTNPGSVIRHFELPNGGYCFAWSQDGKFIFAGGFFRNVVSVNVQASDEPSSKAKTVGDSGFETGAMTLNRAGQLISGHSDGAVRFWRPDRSCRTLHFHDSPVAAMSVSPDGRIGVSVDRDSNLAVWYADSGERIGMLLKGFQAPVAHRDDLPRLCFTPDSKQLRLLGSSSSGMKIMVWDTTSE